MPVLPKYKLSELERPLAEMLQRMLDLQPTRGGKNAVIVDEVVTERFVQFCIPPGGGLLFDLPTGQLKSDYPLNDADMNARGLVLQKTCLLEDGQQQYALQRNFGKAAKAAAHFAINALKEILGLAELGDVECTIEEQTEPAN